MPSIESEDFRLPARDGFALAATRYRPAAAQEHGPAVLVTSAVGVKRGYYDRFARFLAEQGFTTVTFDYRGIGDSRPATLRGFQASLRDWVSDVTGAIDWVVAQHRPHRLFVVSHSIGGQLIGLVPNNDKVHAMLAVAVQSGYWGLWSGSRKLFMWFLWHVMMPGLTAIYSYFPAKRIGFGEDLPAGVARQWAYWGRHRRYIVDDRGKPIRDGFLRFSGAIRSYSFTDDGHAPRAAVEDMIQRYENATRELIHLSAKDVGARAIGHFGFFREQFRSSLWTESAGWLKRQAEQAADATRQAAG